jgi:hypothetical protein
MVTTIKTYNRYPSFWHTDRGKKMLFLADAQFSFYYLHENEPGINLDILCFRDCYMFRTLTANIKLESI